MAKLMIANKNYRCCSVTDQEQKGAKVAVHSHDDRIVQVPSAVLATRDILTTYISQFRFQHRRAHRRYAEWIRAIVNKRAVMWLFWVSGGGPNIYKHPFSRMTKLHPNHYGRTRAIGSSCFAEMLKDAEHLLKPQRADPKTKTD